MKKKRDTLIVIPSYNEAQNIGDVIDKIKEHTPAADILVIDDCSTDDTAKTAKGHGAGTISLPFNLGYGAALETGYKYAVKEGYEYVVHMDADGQHEPKCINDLLKEVKGGNTDIVIGSRYLVDCGYKTSFSKRVGTAIFARMASLITRQKITDPNSGFQAMNRKMLEFYSSGLYPEDYPDADIIILINLLGFRTKEVPVTMYSNPDDKSMHSGFVKPLYYIFKMNLSIIMVLLRKRLYMRDMRK
jgi:glycosyltransferase involved in cell wall biosynthesis